MKIRNLLLAAIVLFSAGAGFAQAPQEFNYQAVVRNSSGNVVPSQSVGLEISIRQTTAVGAIVYTETHSAITSSIGLVNLSIGGGTPTLGTFSAIDWSAGPYFVEIGLDVSGGTSYVTMGTQQLLSVPYALYAESVANVDDADADPSNELQALSLSNDTVYLTNGGFVVLPTFTEVDGDTTNENQTVSAGTGINVVQTGQDFQVTNTAPDQTVTITQGGATTVSGTYPNFTISSTDNVDDADNSPTNEIQTLTFSNPNLSISGGNSVNLSTISVSGTLSSMNYVSGNCTAPTTTTAFLTPIVTVTITSTSQKVHWTATGCFGSTSAGGANSLDIFPGYKLSTATTPTTIGLGVYDLRCAQNTRQTYTVSGTVTGLAPGTYQFGMAGDDDGNGLWNNNEYGYVSVMVFN